MHDIQKRIVDLLLGIYAAPMNFALKGMQPSRRTIFKGNFIKHLYSEDEYFMISSFPRCVHGLPVKGTERDFSDTAILLQGPVAIKDDFTLNTVKMYRQYYNGIKIIVSTWIDTDSRLVERLRDAGADVVLSEYPAVNPPGNLNCQLISALAGVKRAKTVGAKYTVKTRTDQRYYNPCALSMLLGLYEQGKVIMLGGVSNSYCARPFYISDFLAFGETEEIKLIYDCELESEATVTERNKAKGTKEFERFIGCVTKAESDCRISVPQEYDNAVIRYACPETIIVYRYFLRKTNRGEGETAEDAYMRFLRDNMILVDADSLGFYWFKYNWQANNPTYFQRNGKLDAAKWYELRQRG